MERLQLDYESPQARVVQIEAEGALASSNTYLDYKQNPSMLYGDDGEEWF